MMKTARRAKNWKRMMYDLTFTGLIRTSARTTGAWFHANSRLPGHYRAGTALCTRAEEECTRYIREFAEVGAATHGRCRRGFYKANKLKMRVRGTCGLRDRRSENGVEQLTTVAKTN